MEEIFVSCSNGSDRVDGIRKVTARKIRIRGFGTFYVNNDLSNDWTPIPRRFAVTEPTTGRAVVRDAYNLPQAVRLAKERLRGNEKEFRKKVRKYKAEFQRAVKAYEKERKAVK